MIGKKPPVSVLCASAVAGLAACGGSESTNDEEIRPVFEGYQKAVQDRDGETLCDDILAPSQLGSGSVEQCARDFRQALASREFQNLEGVELGDITIEANSASAENVTRGGFFEFRREEGRWGLILIR
jgi:hypothetical protein